MSFTNEEINNHIKEQKEAFTKLTKLWDSEKSESAEVKEKVEKLEVILDKKEEVFQKIHADSQKAENEAKEFKEKLGALEKKFYRMPGGAGGVTQTPEYKAFEKMVKKGEGTLTLEEKAYLRTDVGPDGGFLVPSEMSDEIIKKVTEISPMRNIARVKQTSSKSYTQPVRTSLLSGAGVGEGGTASDSISQYGETEIFTKKMMVVVPLSTEIIQDAAFNMDNEVITDAREDFTQREGQWFVTGAGALEAKGFMNNGDISSSNSGVANDITADSLIDLTGELKVGYDPVFVFKRQTLARIRKFKDGAGAYLWVPSGSQGLAPGAPNEINGERYVIMQDMPSIGAGLKPVAYGDFRRGYLIIDRVGISFLRDDFTLASDGKVRYIVTRRVGGDVVLPEAIVTLTCAV
jgi:HK97 family phage major capsid protein